MKWATGVAVLWLMLFLGTPTAIIGLIALSHPADGVPPFNLGINLGNFGLAASDPLYRDSLARSVRIAGISTAICLIAGYPMAVAISGILPKWRRLLLLSVLLPFWTGFLMRINAWIGLLADDGWIVRFLGAGPLRFTDTAMYIGIVYTYLPFMVLPIYARLSRLDPDLRDAAADLGASPWWVFLRITLPLSLPGIAAGTALVFVPTIGEYVIPTLLGGPRAQLIGSVLWEEFFANRDWPTAAAVAVWLLVVMLFMPWAVAQVLRVAWSWCHRNSS